MKPIATISPTPCGGKAIRVDGRPLMPVDESVAEAVRQRVQEELDAAFAAGKESADADLRISLSSASDALRIHADLNGELSGRYQNAMVKIDTLMDRLIEADHVIALSQLCCITTGAQGCEYQTALDAYKTGAL